MQFYHVVHLYEPNDIQAKNRIKFAQKTWQQFSNWSILPHTNPKRDSTSIGSKRKLPFIQDVIRSHWEEIPEDGIIVFTNTDICLVQEAQQILTTWFAKGKKTCWSYRYDFQRTTHFLRYKHLNKGIFYSGKDLFAFRKSWWEEINFPDLLLGCIGWDWLLYKIMGDENCIYPIIYHERHPNQWLEDGPSNLWNTTLIKEYADKYLIGNLDHLVKSDTKAWTISDYNFYDGI